MKKKFKVIFGGRVQAHGSLRECQSHFTEWRDKNFIGMRSLTRNDGVVLRDNDDAPGFKEIGHFSYNGRFWRTDFMGNRV